MQKMNYLNCSFCKRFVSVKTIEIQRLFSQVSDICRGADIPDQVAGIIEHLENGSGFGGE
jgi:hypothetical protein